MATTIAAQLFHPDAKRVPIPQAQQNLTFTGGGHKVVWHTTEPGKTPRPIRSTDIDGAVSTYHTTGSVPTFTIQVVDGHRTLLQHFPINRAATALRHPQGTPETNRSNAIQVEIVEFAAQSGDWSDALYFYLHHLARWCNEHFAVPMTTPVRWHDPTRLSGSAWVGAAGHVGHTHCPGNDHTDPGRGFHIGRVLDFPPPAPH